MCCGRRWLHNALAAGAGGGCTVDSSKQRQLLYRFGEKEETRINEVAESEWEAVERSLSIHRASGSGNRVEKLLSLAAGLG